MGARPTSTRTERIITRPSTAAAPRPGTALRRPLFRYGGQRPGPHKNQVQSGFASPSFYDISTQPYFPPREPGARIMRGVGYDLLCLWLLEAKDNGWTDASTGNPAHLMSPAWTFNMVDGVGQGTFMDTNAAVITSWGVATMATIRTSRAIKAAGVPRPPSLRPRFTGPYPTRPEIQQRHHHLEHQDAHLRHTPVTFAIDANQYSNGLSTDNIMSASEYTTGSMNHAQTIVGYDDSMTQAGPAGRGRVQGGQLLGHFLRCKGYYWISYDTIKKIGATGLLYPTYITDKPAYQPTLIAIVELNTRGTKQGTRR